MDLLARLNPAQRDAVSAAPGPLLVVAGPGSGKTRVLTHRIAYLIQEMRVSPWHIMAVTFTNKAAREMEHRIEALLDGGGAGQRRRQSVDRASTWSDTRPSDCLLYTSRCV